MVCPECGRSFDPTDPSTFDTRPDGFSRRRWVKRGCIVVAIAIVLFILFPPRLIRSKMTFTCTKCSDVITVRRWEPQAPRWVPFRYPGYHSTARNDPSTATSTASCTHDSRSVKVLADLYYGGSCGGSGTWSPERTILFNHLAALPDSAPAVLKALTAPTNNGIMVYSQPTASQAVPTVKNSRRDAGG